MGNCICISASSPATVDSGKATVPPAAPAKEEKPPPVVAARDEDGNEQLAADYDRKTMEEEEYDYPSSLQEELNEMLEAIYACISEEQIQEYQQYLQDLEKQQIAEKARKARSPAPGFNLIDQDEHPVSLDSLCKEGPVVIQFYRGKWCPHCNAGLMKYKEFLPKIKEQGANLIAISPMLPDGSQFLASKRDLEFAVLSDVGNTVAREYKVTFVVPEFIRPTFEEWGHDVAKANGDELWEIPLAATFIINQEREIVWTFVDNDHGCWAEPAEVIEALKTTCGKNEGNGVANTNSKTRGKGSVKAEKPKKSLFGPKKKAAGDYVSHYPS